MLATTWHLLLVAGLATSFAAIARRVDERLGGALATVLWALVAVGAFEIEQTRTVAGATNRTFNNTTGSVTVREEAGEVVTEASASPELAFLAGTLALVMGAFTLAAATGQLPARAATRYGGD